MRLRFDAAEDRVVLLLEEDGAARAVWLTRRQCIALVLTGREAVQGAAVAAAPRRSGNMRQQTDAWPEVAPQRIELRWRRLPDGLRLLLTTGKKNTLRLDLKQPDLAWLLKTLTQLAHRAQWDIDAALVRIEKRQAGPRTLH